MFFNVIFDLYLTYCHGFVWIMAWQSRDPVYVNKWRHSHWLSLCFLHSHIYVIPAFTWILTLAILLAHTVIQPITSLLTLLKGTLLIVTVITLFFLEFACIIAFDKSDTFQYGFYASTSATGWTIRIEWAKVTVQYQQFDILVYRKDSSGHDSSSSSQGIF